MFGTFHDLYHTWLYNNKGLNYVDFLMPMDFANNIKQAVISWWSTDGNYIFANAKTDFVSWLKQQRPLVMPLAQATAQWEA